MDLTTTSETGIDLSGRRLIGALFPNEEQARNAIDELRGAGFGDADVGYVSRYQEGEMPEDQSSDAAEGALTGALGGGVIGGILGAALALAIPGIGPVIAAGIFTAAATGVGVGAVGGGLVGLLTGMGHEESEAVRLQQGIEAGNVLVSVNAPDRIDEARNILVRNGGDLGTTSSDGIRTIDTTGDRLELL